ncbi:TIGR03364 family FAD-dependent oxidoreductase [Nocardioides daeguensis]|uniref:TIGR03364 family FAD-dependent oxidoreductase n=1 Tax=Nocardioides daeguensis TaxID=908359 RepID=A0ABP6UTH1_9ACTN|nr:TIGR03364 family FAD-dependent oxidoreductase [Nocardioides daeguensis]MBV6728687.1 TIGR03364 family FAD-dependent oxidoreductase [Nocardioides daeguensis]MCR1773704.1 TIGR03364 family FAD-dependent oxidoreductase [Nocardioides daeguensis]
MPTPSAATRTDLAVVGAGILGLAHAAHAVRRGLDVTVVERDHRPVGASIRNFGHVCTTPQAGRAREYALLAREEWLRLGELAGFEVQRAGTVVVARSATELAVLEELAASRGTDEVSLLTPQGVRDHFPAATDEVVGGAHLPRDLRVCPTEAVPALAAWLEERGVDFWWNTHVGAITPCAVHTSRGDITAPYVVHATGHDLDRLFPDLADAYDVRRCRLQMLEVAPPGDVRIRPALLTGTSLLRYAAFVEQPSAATLRREVEATHPELLEVVMNLMLTQRPDGSIVLGDTHHYDRTHLPFDDEDVAGLVLREGARLFGAELSVRRRWRGVYADSPSTDFVIAAPHPGVRAVTVTSGIGMTTGLGLAASVLDELL